MWIERRKHRPLARLAVIAGVKSLGAVERMFGGGEFGGAGFKSCWVHSIGCLYFQEDIICEDLPGEARRTRFGRAPAGHTTPSGMGLRRLCHRAEPC